MGQVTKLYQAAVARGDISADGAQLAVLPALDRLAEPEAKAPAREGFWGRLTSRRAETPPERGLYLWGGVGRGKSMLMDLLVDATSRPVRRVHFHAFMQEIQAGLEEVRKRGEADAIRPVARDVAAQVRLLCFDEMQITDIADAMIVGRLFQILFEEGVVIVTTSNRVPEDLYKNGLNRQLFVPFITLIRERMEVIELVSPRDHRQGRAGGDQVWFTPLDDAARSAMDAAWATLGHNGAEPMILEVHGRDVVLPRAYGRRARASFAELCERPLGAADYLALAQAVDLLLIDDIPQLTSAGANAAKRFVTLIDALYEARVRLMASAEAEPEALYPTGEGAFEFERTASRLREMQDPSWGA